MHQAHSLRPALDRRHGPIVTLTVAVAVALAALAVAVRAQAAADAPRRQAEAAATAPAYVNAEHPGVTQWRRAHDDSHSAVDANRFIVQPPATTSWLAQAPAPSLKLADAQR